MAAGAAAQNSQAQAQARRAAKQADRDALIQSNALSNQARDQATAPGEEMTDRMRTAAQQMSQARVLAAAGVGDLDAMGSAISGSADEDLSRIRVNTRNQMSTLGDQAASVAAQNAATRREANAASNSARIGMFLGFTSAAGGYASTKAANERQQELAKKYGATSKT